MYLRGVCWAESLGVGDEVNVGGQSCFNGFSVWDVNPLLLLYVVSWCTMVRVWVEYYIYGLLSPGSPREDKVAYRIWHKSDMSVD